MADAFRGLTLRLGADARPLQSAISEITRSASQAQAQMNRLNKALKFDTANAAMMQSRIDLMGDKAMHSARAVDKIKTAMRQAASESIKLSTMKEPKSLAMMASDTKEAYSATQKLRSEYNHVNAQLQIIDDDMARIVAKEDKISFNKALRKVRELRKEMSPVGQEANEARQKIERLLGMTSKTGTAEAFGHMKGDAKALIYTYDSLRQHHNALQTDIEQMNKVEAFRAMRTQAQAFKAELREAAAQAARFKTELYALGTEGKLAGNINDIKRLDEVTEKATANAHQMIDAYRAFPKNMGAAVGKIRAVAAAEETLKAKTEAIKGALRKIESDPAFDKQAANSEQAYVKAMKVEKAYENIGTALKTVEAKAEGLRTAMHTMDDSGDKNIAKYQDLAMQLDKAEHRAQELRARLNSMDDAHAAAALVTQFRNLETQLASARVQAAALHSQVSRLRGLSNIGKGMREFGFGMYASLTPAIMMAGRYAIQAAQDIDSAYRDMRKTVNGTDEEFEALKQDAIDFSKTHITSAQQMLEIESIGGQLGIQVEELRDFAHTVSNLDIATNMDSEDIATDLGKMATVLGISTDKYDLFGDALVRLGNNFPAFESDIMKITTRFMGMGKVVGMQPDEMLGWATAATATGQKAEAAGSSMLRFISNMETAVNGSDEKLKAWADVAGMSVDEFRKTFEDDASQAMYKFVEGMGEIQKSGGSVNQLLKELGINNVRDKQLLEGFANQMANATAESNTLADALRLSNDAYNGMPSEYKGKVEQAGDAMREAEKKSEGFSGAIGKMTNQAKALANEAAEGALPIVNDMAGMFETLTNVVAGMPQEMKTAIVGFTGLLAAIGPLNVGLGTFLQSFERIAAFGSGIQGFFVNTAAKLNTLQTGFLATSNAGIKMNLGLQKVFKVLGSTGGLVGIAATAAAIKLVADSIGEVIARHENFKKATDGLEEATGRARAVISGARGDINMLGESTYANTKSWEQLAAAQAKVVDTMNERSSAAESEISQLKSAQSVIDQYTNKDLSGNLTAQGQLAAAIELVNEKCGTQYQVVDILNGKIADENGKLLETVGAIDEYIQAMEKKIRADMLAADYADLIAQRDDQVKALAKQQDIVDKLTRARDSGNIDFKQEDLDTAMAEYQRLYEIVNGTGKAIDMTAESMATLSNEANGQTSSVSALVKANADLNSVFSALYDDAGARAGAMESFSQAIQSAGVTQKEFSALSMEQLLQMATAWKNSGGSIEETLESVGMKTRSVAEQFKQEVTDVQGSADAWDNALKKTKLGGDELAKGLSDVGVSAQQFASISTSSFNALYDSAGGDLAKMRQEMDLLKAAGIDISANTIKINAETGKLETAKGLAIEIGEGMASIDGKEFKLNVQTGQWEEVRKQLDEAEAEEGEINETVNVEGEEQLEQATQDVEEVQQKANEGATVNIDVDDEKLKAALGDILSNGDMAINASLNISAPGVEETLGSWENLKSAVEEGASGKVDVDSKSVSDASSQVSSLSSAVKNIPSKNVSIVVTGGALSEINSIQNALDNMTTYKEITIHTIRTSSGDKTATGAIFNSRGKIPLNAAGALNGIVTRAMMTNIGWVGEAGAEAVFHMKNAGGAVVPLSNRRYVRPFARAVASEMAGTSQQSQAPQTTMNVYLDGRFVAGGVDESTTLGDLARGLRQKARA